MWLFTSVDHHGKDAGSGGLSNFLLAACSFPGNSEPGKARACVTRQGQLDSLTTILNTSAAPPKPYKKQGIALTPPPETLIAMYNSA